MSKVKVQTEIPSGIIFHIKPPIMLQRLALFRVAWPHFRPLLSSYRIKRIMDIVLLLVFSPLLLTLIILVSMFVKSTSRGPVFYSHQRIGQGGRRFQVWKFRTMVQDSDIALQRYLDANPQYRAEWERLHKLRNDPRVTGIGIWLRKTSLDELPQAWNVLWGDMSLVGPRPIVHDEISRYADEFILYTRVLPGITGLWQVSGRNNTTYKKRVRLDVWYVHNWSIWLDVCILVRTIKVILTSEGAY